MISEEDVFEIVEGLLNKTRSNQVNWQLVQRPGRVQRIEDISSFIVHFPESNVIVSSSREDSPDEYYEVSLGSNSGVTVKHIRVREGEPRWETLRDLFEEAGRVVLGWDKVLKDLKTAVQVKGAIGSALIEEEDLPF